MVPSNQNLLSVSTEAFCLQKIGGTHADFSSEDRVRAGAAKLAKMLAAKQQGRLDGFFTVKPKEGEVKKTRGAAGAKRKAEEKGAAKKKGKK